VLRRVVFISQLRAEGMRGRPSRALISITAPRQPPAALQDNWSSVLPFPDYNEHNRFVCNLVARQILARTHPLDSV
jgi:hypothetical protein